MLQDEYEECEEGQLREASQAPTSNEVTASMQDIQAALLVDILYSDEHTTNMNSPEALTFVSQFLGQVQDKEEEPEEGEEEEQYESLCNICGACYTKRRYCSGNKQQIHARCELKVNCKYCGKQISYGVAKKHIAKCKTQNNTQNNPQNNTADNDTSTISTYNEYNEPIRSNKRKPTSKLSPWSTKSIKLRVQKMKEDINNTNVGDSVGGLSRFFRSEPLLAIQAMKDAVQNSNVFKELFIKEFGPLFIESNKSVPVRKAASLV